MVVNIILYFSSDFFTSDSRCFMAVTSNDISMAATTSPCLFFTGEVRTIQYDFVPSLLTPSSSL